MSGKLKITAAENGPYIVKGTAKITRLTDNKVFEVNGRAAPRA